MATATLNLRVSPRRMLSVREAAEYCGEPIKRFPTLCPINPVLMPSGKAMYDLHDLDEWLDGLKSDQPNSDDEIIERLS